MLTVMTQNLNFYGDKHGPWSQRRDLLCETVQETEPDVIALQAVCSEPDIEDGRDQATQISRCMPQYPYVFFYPSRVTDKGREEGCAILSRVALHEPNVRELSLRKGLEDDSPRVIQHARFDLEKGSLNVFNAYFSWVEEQAADNIRECIAFLGRAFREIAGVFGDCIAGGGYMPIISDRVYMTEQAYMVIAGAALIKGAKSQKITSLDIGGPEIHVHRSGCADVRVPDDDVMIQCLRREVSRLPSSTPGWSSGSTLYRAPA